MALLRALARLLSTPVLVALSLCQFAGAQTYTVLRTVNVSNGFDPGPLFRDSKGDIYGVTYSGGTHFRGTVFEVFPDGTGILLHQFATGFGDGQNAVGVLVDPQGNVLGTTFFGGSRGYGTVFEIDASGSETILHDFGPGGLNSPGELVRDPSGNLFGNLYHGHTGDGGGVFRKRSILYGVSRNRVAKNWKSWSRSRFRIETTRRDLDSKIENVLLDSSA